MSLFRGFQEVSPLFRMLDDYASASARPGTSSTLHQLRTFQPKFDVREVKDAYELHGELPGIAQKDISVEWEDGQTLTISGRTERHSTTEPSKQDKHDNHDKQGKPDKQDGTNDASSGTEVAKHSTSKEVSATDEHPKYWLTERSVGEFRRSWTFPTRVNQDEVKANLKDGILSVVVPKSNRPQAKKVTVELS